ncbi:uncharacterized protein CIMG_09581 [Coccidioides immitis RS]|uniref:Uncharacterized protein n=1 Tax=Coccidioides immitis (strain RS) TaxID=246410 RepID=J3K2P2_COCIM|nr:uncharacterized protein CIMG_09581 [Coccidioides immitis RS]EAS28377.3 hypothetical protein CIMG_09581 [Coccidioides immitis RS]
MKHRTPDPAYKPTNGERASRTWGIREDNHGSKHGGWRIHRTIPTHCKDCQEAYCQAVWDQQLCHMEAVLKVAELADAEDIILEEQEDSPRPDNPDITRFWRAKNNWLYDLIDSTITTQARVYFKQPGGLQALENMTRQSAGGERNCIERFLAIRMELERMGLKYHDHALHDILKENITPQWREFIQNTYNMAYNKGADLQGHNLEGLLKG